MTRLTNKLTNVDIWLYITVITVASIAAAFFGYRAYAVSHDVNPTTRVLLAIAAGIITMIVVLPLGLEAVNVSLRYARRLRRYLNRTRRHL